jgi:hypothetical protein
MKYQNHHHHGGVFDTWTKWGQTLGRVGLGAGWPVDQGLRRFDPKLGCHACPQGGEAQVGGSHYTRPATHVAWPPGHHLVPNRLLQVSGGPIHPYKYPPHSES